MNNVPTNQNEFWSSARSIGDGTPIVVNVAGEAVQNSDELIRFPHIPSRFRTLPGKGQYRLANGHLMRMDSPHGGGPGTAPQPWSSSETERNAHSEVAKTDSEILAPPSHRNAANEAEAWGADSREISREQVVSIADYLRRKKEEIEAENTELALHGWQLHQLVLEQREQLRRQAMALRRTRSLLDQLRCDLIEMGSQMELAGMGKDPIMEPFQKVCETFFRLHEESKQLG